jgi:molybdopterin-guanine dinucleotide biosynthesis protein A
LVPAVFFQKLENWSPGFDIVIPQDSGGQLHPLSGTYSKNCLPAIEELANQKYGRVLQLLESPRLKTRILKSEEHGLNRELFLNVNTHEDYRELLRRS